MGQVHRIRGNQSLLLNDPETIWVIQSGAMALFAVSVSPTIDFERSNQSGNGMGARHYLFDCQAGEAMFAPSESADLPLGILAVSLEETILIPLSQVEWKASLAIASVASETTIPLGMEAMSTWLQKLATVESPPEPPLEPSLGLPLELPLDSSVDPSFEPVDVSVALAFKELDRAYSRFLQRLIGRIVQEQAALQSRFQSQEGFEQQLKTEAIAALASVLQPDLSNQLSTIASGDHEQSDYRHLYMAIQAIGRSLGVNIRVPKAEKLSMAKAPLGAIAHASRLRIRRVLLTDHWWRHDSGALLAYTRATNQPVALLPTAKGRYTLFEPSKGAAIPVTAAMNDQLSPVAYVFYRPLPEVALRAIDLLRFSLIGTRKDWFVVVWAGIAAALLGMMVPQAMAILIDQAIPGGDRQLLVQVGIGLLAATLGGVLFQLTQGFALVRLEAIIEASAQTALWDRLLSLDIPFFRRFAVGDLRSRVAIISLIRRQVSGGTLRLLFSSGFALLNLGLLFYYSLSLGLVASAIALLTIAITILLGKLTLNQVLPLQEQEGNIFGLMVQLINGVAKLRMAGAEERAFAYWSKQYSRQQALRLTMQQTQDHLTIVNQVLPILGAALMFGVAAEQLQTDAGSPSGLSTGLSTGSFLAANVAFGSFIRGIATFSSTLVDVFAVFSLSQRTLPILKALPEVDSGKSDPGRLSGRLALERVTFRYSPECQPILDNVSLHVKPGEFVAIVGASGSGKSTIFRLLLGFETPQFGQVTYDGQDLRGLDKQAVRQQLGVLLQTGRTMTASIFENIAGSAPITMDDAWEAAQLAGLAEDIAAMPMGMHTVVSEGGGNLSGGQRQRLLIARSLALKPRILLFDEATSALDNRTQAIVSTSLDKLRITRVVIAHRLSTIKNADRIYVLQSGHIIQQGTFEVLIQQDGLFRQLMRRQMG